MPILTCNWTGCGKPMTRVFDHENLCDSHCIDRLVEEVEHLKTGYVRVSATLVYEEDR